MRRGRLRSRVPLNAEINIVSLIDVMMLLMIIFMITAPLLTGGVDVKLPKARVRAAQVANPLIVLVMRDGVTMVDNERVSRDELPGRIAALAARAAGRTVFLKGDEGAPYGDVLTVLAALKDAGLTNVSLVAEPITGK
jgi:biopolymer transport protein TolR